MRRTAAGWDWRRGDGGLCAGEGGGAGQGGGGEEGREGGGDGDAGDDAGDCPTADSTTEGTVTVGGQAIAYTGGGGDDHGGVDRRAGRDARL